MLLKKLKLKGFKSYQYSTIIDFSKIPLDDLFLIQGNTGAGKSSILDALTFALYGAEKKEYLSFISNSIREEVEKNPYSYKGKHLTEVELEFSYQGSLYTIKRFIKVKHFRQFKNINEIYELNLQSFLNGKEISEVPKLLKKLNREQFTKAVLIPQNQFDQFLKSSPLEKEEILKKIFNTSKFDGFIKFLNDKKNKLISEINNIKIKIEEILKNTNIQKSIEDQEIITEINKKISDNRHKIDKIKKQLEEMKNHKSSLEEEKNKLTMFYQQLLELKKVTIQQKSILIEEKEIENKKKRLQNAKKVEEIYRIRNELSKLEENLKKKRQETLKLEEELKRYENELKIKKEEFSKLQKQKEMLEQSQIEILKKEEILPKLSLYKKIQNEIQELKKEKEKKQIQIESIHKKLETLNSQLEEIYRYYFSKKLIPNEPCLICGSKEHPHPFTSDLISDPVEILKIKEKIEMELKDLNKKMDLLLQQIRQKENEIYSIETYLKQNQYSIYNLEVTEAQLKKEIQNYKIEQEHYKKQYNETQIQIQKLENSLGKVLGSKETNDEFILEVQKEIQQKQNEYVKMLQKEGVQESDVLIYYLESDKKNLLEKEINSYQERSIQVKTKIEELLKKISNSFSEFSFSLIQNETEIDVKLKHIIKNIQEIEKKINDYEELMAKKNQEQGLLLNENKRLLDALVSLETYLTEYTKLSNEFRLIHTIWYLVSDENPKHLSFHRYIIQAYFDSVIQYANLRLEKIEPRFILRTTEEKEDLKKKKAGLSIRVFDVYQGERGIEGLSGGEMFYISIAMALGLYDVIHSNLSDVRFDFLFIDEGFGSLDKEKLHKVLSMIKEIFLYQNQSSQKQVGLISHVESMKEQIPYQIIVKNKNGISFVELPYV